MTKRWLWRSGGILAIMAGLAILAYCRWVLDMHELFKHMFSVLFPPQENPALMVKLSIGALLGFACVAGGVVMLARTWGAWARRESAGER
jgi:hypothetical protein